MAKVPDTLGEGVGFKVEREGVVVVCLQVQLKGVEDKGKSATSNYAHFRFVYVLAVLLIL